MNDDDPKFRRDRLERDLSWFWLCVFLFVVYQVLR